MRALQPAVVGLTDDAWFRHFRPDDARVEVDEVNFWRPLAQTQFRALEPGQPFFFRLKAPDVWEAEASFALLGLGGNRTPSRRRIAEPRKGLGAYN